MSTRKIFFFFLSGLPSWNRALYRINLRGVASLWVLTTAQCLQFFNIFVFCSFALLLPSLWLPAELQAGQSPLLNIFRCRRKWESTQQSSHQIYDADYEVDNDFHVNDDDDQDIFSIMKMIQYITIICSSMIIIMLLISVIEELSRRTTHCM